MCLWNLFLNTLPGDSASAGPRSGIREPVDQTVPRSLPSLGFIAGTMNAEEVAGALLGAGVIKEVWYSPILENLQLLGKTES